MGDYIERKRVIDLITSRYECPEICEKEINEIPSADVAPVVYGRWLNITKARIDTTGICAVCGEESVWRTKNATYANCPNCGAKMYKED